MVSHRFRLVLLIAVAAVVLGIGTTAALAATAPNTHGGPFVSAPASCDPPALPGTIVNATLADMPGTMMGPGTMGPGMMAQGMMGPGWNSRYGPEMMGSGPGAQYGPPSHGYPWPGMRMMSILIDPVTVPAGQVSFQAINAGVWIHELYVMPLGSGQSAGQRVVGADGRVDKSGVLGEVETCAEDSAGGDVHHIVPGGIGWTTITLRPGRYELICNLPGHYAAGMYTELTVAD